MVALGASFVAYVADEGHVAARHWLHAFLRSSAWVVSLCCGHSEYLSWARRAFGLRAKCS